MIDGGDYLAEQLELHRTWIADESRSNRATLASRDDLLGYPLTDARFLQVVREVAERRAARHSAAD